MNDEAIKAMDDVITKTLGIEKTLNQDAEAEQRADDIALGFEAGYAAAREALRNELDPEL